LRSLGWEILRIWSTDWWVDPSGTLERICKQLDEHLTVSRAKRAVEAARIAAEAAACETIEKAMAEVTIERESSLSRVKDDNVEPNQMRFESDRESEEAYARQVSVPNAGERPLKRLYVECDLAGSVDVRDPDAFFDKSYDERLKAMIAYVVAEEGPVLDLVLARRISRAHGWQRTGSRIQVRIEALARNLYKTTEEDVGTFYWPESMAPGSAVEFRSPGPDAQRSMDEICMEELVTLAASVVDPAATDDDNLVAMARELGVLRLRASSRGRLEEAVRRFRRTTD
ncbi:MAG TPA: DUF3320 domain-containing protein, partial [Noviherbaspirillum sp.]